MGSPLWAGRARRVATLGLTLGRRARVRATSRRASEERVARLAAAGLTNRQVANALQISPKTVEAHLARVYRKLDIHSRAELGARIALGGRAGRRARRARRTGERELERAL